MKEALSPSLSFSGTLDDAEIGGEIDLASSGKPKSIWGKKSATVGGWNIKTRVELSQGEYSFGKGEDTGAYVTIQGNSDDQETFVWGSGAVSKSKGEPLKVGAKKIFPTNSGKFMGMFLLLFRCKFLLARSNICVAVLPYFQSLRDTISRSRRQRSFWVLRKMILKLT